MSADATIYVNADRTILLTVWADGTHELALRDESRRWLPPVVLERESLDVTLQPGDGCQLLGDNKVKHVDCNEYPSGTVTDVRTGWVIA